MTEKLCFKPESAFKEVENFSVLKKFVVTFVGVGGVQEDGCDAGGLTREMCTLLVRQLKNLVKFIEGPEDEKWENGGRPEQVFPIQSEINLKSC